MKCSESKTERQEKLYGLAHHTEMRLENGTRDVRETNTTASITKLFLYKNKIRY